MPREQTPFGRHKEMLDDCLDKLKKYANDPEWKDLPGYDQRVQKNIEGARAAFSNLLNLVMPKAADKVEKKVS